MASSAHPTNHNLLNVSFMKRSEVKGFIAVVLLFDFLNGCTHGDGFSCEGAIWEKIERLSKGVVYQ